MDSHTQTDPVIALVNAANAARRDETAATMKAATTACIAVVEQDAMTLAGFVRKAHFLAEVALPSFAIENDMVEDAAKQYGPLANETIFAAIASV